MEPTLIIPNSRETYVISVRELLFIEASGNYSTFWLTNRPPMRADKNKSEKEDGTPHNMVDITIALQLGVIHEMIKKSKNDIRKSLVRIGRSYIVNINYIFKIDITNSMLYLMDSDHNVYKLEDTGRDNLIELKKELEK